MRALIALVAILLAAPVQAHSWYPYDCCSDRDCWPMGLDADAREPDPVAVAGAVIAPSQRPVCLFVPSRGM